MGRYAYADRWFESEEDHAYAQDAMRRMDCLQFRERLFSTLSGGEQQRALLAACIAQCPAIMLFDEPSTYFDIHQQLHCFTTLAELAREGALCIAVTHDLNLALAHCTRVLILDQGELAADLAVHDASQDPEMALAAIAAVAYVPNSGRQAVGTLSMIASRSSSPAVGWIGGSAVTFLLAAFLLPWVGSGSISMERVFEKASPDYPIFFELRVSRTLLGLLAGGALSLTGSLSQSMLRESLATPYTLGVSAGAALGAVLTLAEIDGFILIFRLSR